MVYVLIGVALLFVIVPIIAVLPSARQKTQMKMRTAAREVGVQVELTTIDDPNPDQDKYTSHIGKKLPTRLNVAAYRLQRKREQDWRQLPEVNWSLYRDLEKSWHWRSPPADEMHPELVAWLDNSTAQLPEDVEQVEENRYTITVYWHERTAGTEQQVFDFLQSCADKPLIAPVDEDE